MTRRKVKRGGARKRPFPTSPDARLIKLAARYVAAEKYSDLASAGLDTCTGMGLDRRSLAVLTIAAVDATRRASDLEMQVTKTRAHTLAGAVAKAQAIAAMFSGGPVEAGPNFLERDIVASLVNDLLRHSRPARTGG